MVNNLVFRWPKHSWFMVLGAHGIHIWGINSQADLMWKHPLKNLYFDGMGPHVSTSECLHTPDHNLE